MGSSLTKGIISLLFSCLFASHASAKDIRKPALDLAYEHFAYSAVLEILSGKSELESQIRKRHSDILFLGELEGSGVIQRSYMSLKPHQVIYTLSIDPASKDRLGFAVTVKADNVPISDIKYLAFSSDTYGEGKEKHTTFYMGDGAEDRIRLRHIIKEDRLFLSDGDPSRVTWLYTVMGN
jgi:hypothetical protein